LIVPELVSDRLTLEPLSPVHGPGMFELWSSPEVCRFSGPAVDRHGDPIVLPAPSGQESDKLVDFWVHRRETGTGFRWAIIINADGRFVGATGFNTLGPCSEYAYHLHPEHWGRGLMLEASRLALEWLFSHGTAEAADAFIEPANVRSVRLIERLGFEPTGESTNGADRYVLVSRASL
jgi:ribosomal-protein-alanine N-acetyltransferase